MLSTREHFRIDPKQFKDMTYTQVLDVKRKAAEEAYKRACKVYFGLPLTKEYEEEANEANREMLRHKKSLEVITLWQEEMK